MRPPEGDRKFSPHITTHSKRWRFSDFLYRFWIEALHSHTGGNPLGDLGKTLWIWLSVDPFGPDLKSIRRVNDPRRDVQQVIVLAHFAFKYDLNVKFSVKERT